MRDLARGLQLFLRYQKFEHGTPEQLAEWQTGQLQHVVRHAVARSRYYRELCRNVDVEGKFTLKDLPITNKRMMMDHFDDWVAVPDLKLAEIERQIERDPLEQYYLGEYRIVVTSGSSGLRGIFVYDRAEWSVVIAAAFRWAAMFGVSPLELSYKRLASIKADKPTHATSRLGQSMDLGIRNLLMLDATVPLDELVERLNAYQPQLLMGYASIIGLLAVEQIDGRLTISPEMIATFSEVLGADRVARSQEAWGLTTFDHYGAAEQVMIAAECDAHKGLHQFADMSIVEIVDADNRPVPPGTPGHHILLTNLHKFIQPVIRYEITDIVTEAVDPCTCDRPFPLFSFVGGRTEDVFHLPGRDGKDVAVSPMIVSAPMVECDEVVEFQYSVTGSRVALTIVPRRGVNHEVLERDLRERLVRLIEGQGAKEVSVEIAFVDRIVRSSETMGKLKLLTPHSP